MLKSRTTWPPKGWLFLEPSTGWRAPAGLTFDQTVKAIIEHRQRNRQYRLATDYETVAAQLDEYTCARLKHNSSWCTQSVPFPQPLPAHQPQPAEAVSVAGESRFISNTSAGIKLWIEWFGEGMPVDQATANRRAGICSKCEFNDRAVGWLKRFTNAAATEIMAIFSALHDLDLHTSQDNQLNVCLVCDCPLKAKVWAPIDIIKKHMPAATAAKLPSHCWIKSE